MAKEDPQQAIAISQLIATTAVQGAKSAMLPATLNVEANLRRRVFNEGVKADGTSIGKYSTSPMYLHIATAQSTYGSTLPLSGIAPRGKPSAGKKRGAKARKVRGEVVPLQSRYYPGGYAEFRREMGRQSDHVDLMLSGELAGSIRTGRVGDEAVISFVNDEAREKADGNEIRFGNVAGDDEPVIFIANGTDAEELLTALTDAATRAVEKLFAQ